MIPFFPDPYPDELLYSVCARYADRVYPSTVSSLRQELSGNKSAKAIIDLASRLDYLVSILPPGHNYTADYFMKKHTLLPFYSPFLQPERVQRLRQDMRGDNVSGMYLRAGISAKGILSSDWIRYCPVCVEEERRQSQECYWHRVHQVPGVNVCPIHEVFLENSNVRTRHRIDSRAFISAEQAIQKVSKSCSIDKSNISHNHLLKIAQSVDWLLQQCQPDRELFAVRKRYCNLLAQKGLASPKTTSVHPNQFRNAFKSYYPDEFLKLLNHEIDDRRQNWLFKLVRSASCPSHPLSHLLLIHFLGYTPQSFFNLPVEYQPFGEAGWPCLNPVCKDFLKLSIIECAIKHDKSSGKPVGTFKCPCGFIYRRQGPDILLDDRFRVGVIISRGKVWEKALIHAWEDPKISLTTITKQLKASFNTIKTYAVKLKLSFPRKSTNRAVTVKPSIKNPENIKLKIEKKKHFYRQEWLTAREQYPNANPQFYTQNFNRIFLWLRRNDLEWLQNYLPPSTSRQYQSKILGKTVNWSQRDEELSTIIKDIANYLKNEIVPPKRVSISAISRELKQRRTIQNDLHKLPLVAKVLEEVVETYEEAAIRRIWWYRNCYLVENICPKRWQFIKRIQLSKTIINSSNVQSAIDFALQSLIELSK